MHRWFRLYCSRHTLLSKATLFVAFVFLVLFACSIMNATDTSWPDVIAAIVIYVLGVLSFNSIVTTCAYVADLEMRHHH